MATALTFLLFTQSSASQPKACQRGKLENHCDRERLISELMILYQSMLHFLLFFQIWGNKFNLLRLICKGRKHGLVWSGISYNIRNSIKVNGKVNPFESNFVSDLFTKWPSFLKAGSKLNMFFVYFVKTGLCFNKTTQKDSFLFCQKTEFKYPIIDLTICLGFYCGLQFM